MVILNPRLIEKQNLTDTDITELFRLHSVKDVLFLQMEATDNIIDIVLYFELLEALEYSMQRVWKFSQDKIKINTLGEVEHLTMMIF